jgi:EAL domain-containing protein (putative c-di-GMP-specific phosphodiesterase class I)
MGGVVYGVDGTDADALLQNADFALYHAKDTHRGGYVPFELGMRTSITRLISTIKEVDDALTDGRVLPFYQPVVCIESGELLGFEALARMKGHDNRIVAASSFQSALADPKIAYRLTERMLSRVVGDMRSWIADGLNFQHIGINLSAADCQRNDLEGRILRAFEAGGVPLQHLLLEVTETVFMGGPKSNIAKAIERLRSRGMLIALDDFGTGFASLTHLLSFPVDFIKIDRSFIDRLLTDRSSHVIVEAMIDIARKLGMRVVAEGVESAGQAMMLREMGCNIAQGYYFARPGDFETASGLMRSAAKKDAGERTDVWQKRRDGISAAG